MIKVLKFYSPTCGPCKANDFILEGIKNKYPDKYELLDIQPIDTSLDESQDLIEEYLVRSVPLLVFLKDGKDPVKLTGIAAEPRILSAISALQP